MCWLVGDQKYFEERSLYWLFWNMYLQAIFKYLLEIGVFYKIWSMLRKSLREMHLKSCFNFNEKHFKICLNW